MLHSKTGPRLVQKTRGKKKEVAAGSNSQKAIIFAPIVSHPRVLVARTAPLYSTDLGAAYVADSLQLMKEIPAGSIAAVVTSPPYALHFKKEYGNVDKAAYVEWFLPFAQEIKRILKPDGSFILNIGGSTIREARQGRCIISNSWWSCVTGWAITWHRNASGTTPPSCLPRPNGSTCVACA